MTQVVTVKFRGRGKAYYFDPAGIQARPGDLLVVETAKGMELGNCLEGNHEVADEAVVQPLRPVVRAATADDLRVAEINRSREAEAFGICRDMIRKHRLEMKLVDVECSFEGNKILFFFTADGRVDFRELVKDLAGVFRTRIELRQIGVRDEAQKLGGLGICGRPFCCHEFVDEFQPVSTKMAKTQSMSLNPVKISGTCGRLMCCLRYEQEAYEDLVKRVPKSGAFVETIEGYGNVTQVNLLRQTVKVRLDGQGDDTIRTFDADQVAEVPGGRPPEGTEPPHVLHYVPKPKEEPEEDEWNIPTLFAELPAEEKRAPAPENAERGEQHRRSPQRRRPRGVSKEAGKADKTEKAEKTERTEKPAAPAKTPRKGGAPASAAEIERAPSRKNHRPRRNHNRGKGGGEKRPEA